MHLLSRKLCRLIACLVLVAMGVCQNGALASIGKLKAPDATTETAAVMPCHDVEAEKEEPDPSKADCDSVCQNMLPHPEVSLEVPHADSVQAVLLVSVPATEHPLYANTCLLHDSALTHAISPPPAIAYCRLLN